MVAVELFGKKPFPPIGDLAVYLLTLRSAIRSTCSRSEPPRGGARRAWSPSRGAAAGARQGQLGCVAARPHGRTSWSTRRWRCAARLARRRSPAGRPSVLDVVELPVDDHEAWLVVLRFPTPRRRPRSRRAAFAFATGDRAAPHPGRRAPRADRRGRGRAAGTARRAACCSTRSRSRDRVRLLDAITRPCDARRDRRDRAVQTRLPLAARPADAGRHAGPAAARGLPARGRVRTPSRSAEGPARHRRGRERRGRDRDASSPSTRAWATCADRGVARVSRAAPRRRPRRSRSCRASCRTMTRCASPSTTRHFRARAVARGGAARRLRRPASGRVLRRSAAGVAQELMGSYLEFARTLGMRTAGCTSRCRDSEDAAFQPEPFTMLYQRSLYQSLQTRRCAADGALLLRDRLTSSCRRKSRATRAVVAARATSCGASRRCSDTVSSRRASANYGDLELEAGALTGPDFVIVDLAASDALSAERRVKVATVARRREHAVVVPRRGARAAGRRRPAALVRPEGRRGAAAVGVLLRAGRLELPRGYRSGGGRAVRARGRARPGIPLLVFGLAEVSRRGRARDRPETGLVYPAAAFWRWSGWRKGAATAMNDDDGRGGTGTMIAAVRRRVAARQ